jgi:hypothetical protein
MLDQRDDNGVEDLRLLRRWLLPSELEKGEFAEIHVAKDLAWQIAATHGDPVGRAPCDIGADRRRLTAHGFLRPHVA